MNYQNMLVTLKAQATPELTEDIEKLIKKLEKERDSYRNQLLDSRDRIHQQDYQVENQKKIIESTKAVLESYERENKALRTLVREWV